MAITELTRGHVMVRVGDRSVRIQCEMLIPTPGETDYRIYSGSIRCWAEPFNEEAIDEATKDMVIKEVVDHLLKTGRVPEVL